MEVEDLELIVWLKKRAKDDVRKFILHTWSYFPFHQKSYYLLR